MNILVYVGKSGQIKSALQFASLLSKSMGAKITLLHVLARGEAQEAGQDMLNQAKDLIAEGNVELLLRWGDPAGVLLSEANQGKYSLFILQVGPKARGMPRLVPLDKIISQSIFPSVLVVRQGAPKLEHILVCSSGGYSKNEVFISSANLAKANCAKVTLLHVASGAVPSMYTGLHEIEETLEELLKTDTPIAQHLRKGAEILENHHVEGELELRRGIPIDEIVREVNLGDYDLLVIGRSRVSKGLKEFFLGDIMQQILTQVTIPILVVGEKSLS